jgi:putative endonuclease
VFLPFFVFLKHGLMQMTAEENGACFLYVLYSGQADLYYTGISANPERRLAYHNTRERGFTSRYRPWKIVFQKSCVNRNEAHRLERKIKSWKSRLMIDRLISGNLEL